MNFSLSLTLFIYIAIFLIVADSDVAEEAVSIRNRLIYANLADSIGSLM